VDVGNFVSVGEGTAVAVSVAGISVCVGMGEDVTVAGWTLDLEQPPSRIESSINR
jgi:hypothetical protein